MVNNLLSFFPSGFDATKYAIRPQSNEPPSVLAWQHLTSLGYKPPFLQPGKLMRFPDASDMAKGDSRGQGGWCIYHEHQNMGVLTFGSWHEGDKQTWTSVDQEYMDTEQRQAFLDAIDAAKRLRDEQERIIKEQAQSEFFKIWESAPPCPNNHPYLVRKAVKSHGLKLLGDKALIPMYNHEKLVGLQTIDSEGNKKFEQRSTKGFFIIGADDINERLFVAEGYSTAASIYEATGTPIAVAFDAGNIFPVCSSLKNLYPSVEIVICADDDKHGEVNTGMMKAKRAADTLGLRVIAPQTNGTDFNDMAMEGHDIKAYINSLLETKQPKKRKADIVEEAQRPNGALGLIYDYYNATSGYDQKGFAIQTALAIASVVCARNFKTDNNNYASIYLLNVGKTATGKEHCKTIMSVVLRSAGMDNLIIGDGFTSTGAVTTELLRKPRCVVNIDEFGLYLEAANSKGNSAQKEANSTIMQAFGRAHDVLLSKNYSAMTIKEKDINDRKICNPALTMVGMTTPKTFFDNISSRDIHSGFLNRFLVSVSNTQIGMRKNMPEIDVPESIKDWLLAIKKRAEKATPIETSADFSNPIIIKISQPAWAVHNDFEREIVKTMIKYEPAGLDGLFGRAAEVALRVALICALSRDPQTNIIGDIDMIWACDYVGARYKQLLDAVAGNVVENQFQRDCQDVLEFIESCEEMKATRTAIFKRFRKHSTRQMDEIIKTMLDADMIEKKVSNNVGRPSEWYFRKE